MQNDIDPAERSRHLALSEPSPWIARFAALAPAGGSVLDLAAGGGRHARVFLDRGHPVTAIDKNTSALDALPAHDRLTIIGFDMEAGEPVFEQGGPLAGQTFDTIVVVNYLYRPHFPGLLDALAAGGLLLYETFALGNEAFARPRNPDHLLKSGELLELTAGRMQIVAYEHGLLEGGDIPGVKQRLCAVKDLSASQRADNEPPAHPI
ncbi:MAG: methyltransferase domain-containing protein [Rhodospirillales bacterium]|nr:methyltransferase domain-containing protein [Rhodospirillales bacterium]